MTMSFMMTRGRLRQSGIRFYIYPIHVTFYFVFNEKRTFFQDLFRVVPNLFEKSRQDSYLENILKVKYCLALWCRKELNKSQHFYFTDRKPETWSVPRQQVQLVVMPGWCPRPNVHCMAPFTVRQVVPTGQDCRLHCRLCVYYVHTDQEENKQHL